LKKSSYGMEEDDDDEEEEADDKGGDSTDSDFDDDEDPDEIEVPGGGKDLATVATLTKKYKTESASSSNVVGGLNRIGMAATGINKTDLQSQQPQQQQQKLQPVQQLNKITNFVMKQPSKDSIAAASGGSILSNASHTTTAMKPSVGSRIGGGVGTTPGTGGSG
uniref:Centromere protein CENP-B C-terminal domain-containing protein n=1 Tax=Anopheles maculatus TaxID=74869 RepID=A0A182SQ29_9DIPT